MGHHKLLELLVRDLTVPIDVDLIDDFVNQFVVKVLTEGKNSLKLFGRNGTSSVLVEHLECRVQLAARIQRLHIHCGNDKFGVVNGSTVVRVDLRKHLIDLLIGQALSEMLRISFLNLILRELTIAIEVHGSKNIIDF
jgi:hypothetical protein